MLHRSIPVATRWLAGLLLLSIVAASCSEHVTDVDASYTTPEGTFSPDARLLVWSEAGNLLSVYGDNVPPGPDPGDPLQSQATYTNWGVGSIHGLIMDRTAATQYEAFRTENNGGIRRFDDFTVPRTRTWLDSQWESYHFADAAPPSPRRYFARGLVDRMASPTSPLSNEGLVGTGDFSAIDLTAVWWPQNAPTYVENRGRVKLNWSTVPGAARYLIQIYTFGPSSTADQRIRSGIPAPLFDGWVHDYYVAFAPPDVNLLFAGDSTRTDIETVTHKRLVPADFALARVSALDENGRMIATTPGVLAVEGLIAGEGTYGIYSLNAVPLADTGPPPILLTRDIPTLGHVTLAPRPGAGPKRGFSRR